MIGYPMEAARCVNIDNAADWARAEQLVTDLHGAGVRRAALRDVPGLEFMPEAPWGMHTRWLTTVTLTPAEFGMDRDELRQRLDAANIEARPVWKPMHLQRVFGSFEAVGGSVSEDLFRRGLCLPSGSSLTSDDLERVIGVVREAGHVPALTKAS